MAESKARLAELDEQIKQARASGASEEEIQALKDQKAQVEEQLAQTKQKVEDNIIEKITPVRLKI